jgi:flagellar hook-associated protein 2
MSQTQSGVGLITGLNISQLVSELMTVSEQPVTALNNQNTQLQNEQTAYQALMADLLGVQNAAKSLQQSALYTASSATSSDSSALTATVTGSPALGTYQFTPLQVAQAQQLLTNGFQSQTSSLGGGQFTFRFGADLNQTASLDNLNGGAGFVPGEIKITDSSGASAVVDLSAAQSIGDVLNDINDAGLGVTAQIDPSGTSIDLVDTAGGTSSLTVQEVGGGTTAASLGLIGSGVKSTATTIDGQDIYYLSGNLSLDALNNGSGVSTSTALPDIGYTLANGDSGTIDLWSVPTGSTTGVADTTLGQVVAQINAAAPKELTASIDPTTNQIVVTDSTSGGGTFSLTAKNGSAALYDLGLAPTASDSTVTGADGTISGRNVLGGLQGVLLNSLNGGAGLGQLGNLDLTDRNGHSATVNLSSAQTLQQVINDINQAKDAHGDKLGITAEINAAGNGLELVDTTGSTASNMIVANDADETGTATALGIVVDGAVTSVNSGDLHLQVVSMNTPLADLNGGGGVAAGTLTLTDSAGASATLTVTSSMQTVGDVVNAINQLNVGTNLDITASINATGDGILLTDSSGGSGKLTVAEGSSTTAADLGLIGPNVQSAATTIDGTTTQTIALAAGDSLQTLESDINNRNAGVTASIISDGSSNPYRLLLTSNQPGQAGTLVIDTSKLGTGMSLTQVVQPQDALLALGDAADSASSVLVSSSSNNFTNVLPGATVQVQSATDQPVSLAIANDPSDLVAAVQAMINDYNSFQSGLAQDTSYDTTSNTGAVLASDPTATELGNEISALMNGQISGVGSISSLSQLGVTVNSDGSLALDTSTLSSAYAADPAAVQQFFTQTGSTAAPATDGFAVQLDNLMTQVAGQNNSLLSTRISAVSNMMQQNTDQINSLNTMLSNEQNNLYTQYYQMENAISQLQTNMSIVNTLSLLNTDGTSTSIFSPSNSSDLGSNLADIISAQAAAQATAAESSSTSSSGASSTT